MSEVMIRMLGDFTLQAQETQISDYTNRSRKVWLLLAYLIYNRHRVISQAELMDLLWGESSRGSNPTSALKTTFHRVRSTLDQLWPDAGHQMILRRDNGYVWNSEISVTLDIDRFDDLCRTAAQTEEEQLQIALDALKLYQGDFLSRYSSEPWVMPLTTYYHNLYVQILLKAVPLLLDRGQPQEVANLCRTASVTEPYHDTIHYYWMRALLELNDHAGAAAVYKDFNDRLFSNFGILPPEELRKLYREAMQNSKEQPVTMETILEHLREQDSSVGALMCEYDFFIVLCRSVARSMSRTGFATHIALLSVVGESGGEVSKRSLPHVMENLGEQIRICLRKGDAASRCSSSQYILMLPQANYENSCMICDRIIKAYNRRYPHSPAKLQFMTYPLQPNP